MRVSRREFGLAALAAAAAIAAPSVIGGARAFAGAGSARNVILMISDGAGFHTWNAASYYSYGELGREAYDSFPVRTVMTTYPLHTGRAPSFDLRPQVSYDPAMAWSKAPSEGEGRGYPSYFEGYDYVKRDYVDSAAAGTALAAGVKTYNNAINFDNLGRSIRMIGEAVKSAGKGLGVVTSVQISHATPAAFCAHNVSRGNYSEIGREIVETGLCDVIMGCGHPFYDRNGTHRAPESAEAYRYVGGPEVFERVLSGRSGYQLIEARKDFEGLAAGRLNLSGNKIMGVARVERTLQYDRAKRNSRGLAASLKGAASNNLQPSAILAGGVIPSVPLIASVPTLATMTRGALEHLGAQESGFFLMVEGGAVDWAAHDNDTERLVEEQIEFNKAVCEVVDWVEANGGFENTLVIVTTDHGNGILYGPESDAVAFQPVASRGKGQLPEVMWHSDQHTNELVPVWAKGPGAELLVEASSGEDPRLGLVGFGEVSRYHDNTDIARVMATALGLSLS